MLNEKENHKTLSFKNLFHSAFSIQPQEFGLVQSFFLYYTTIGMFYTLGAASGDTMLLSRFGENARNLLPWVYIGIALSSMVITSIYDFVQGKIPRRVLLTVLPLILSGSVLGLRLLLGFINNNWIYFCLVVWLETCALISIMLFFSLAGDYFTSRDARRLYGYISGGLPLGTILAGFCTKFLAGLFGIQNLLYVVAALQLGCSFWVMGITRFKKPVIQHEKKEEKESKAPFKTVFSNPYILLIIALVFAGFIYFRLVEFQFMIKAVSEMQNVALAVFFGKFYSYLGITQLCIQFLLVGWLFKNFGVTKSLVILPLLVISSGVAFYFFPGMLIIWASTNFVRLTFSETLDIPSRELLFLPLPKRIRLRAQALFSGALVPLGTGLGGALILLCNLFISNIRDFSFSIIGFAGLCVIIIFILGFQYRRLLARSLETHKFSPSDLNMILQQSKAVELFSQLLDTDDEEQLITVLELLDKRPIKDAIFKVRLLVHHENKELAIKAIGLLGRHGDEENLSTIRSAIKDVRVPVRAAAIIAFASIAGEKSIKSLAKHLKDPEPEIQGVALAGLIRYGGFEGALIAYPILYTLLKSKNIQKRLLATLVLSKLEGRGFTSVLTKLLGDPEAIICERAIEISATLNNADLIPALFNNLENRTLRPKVLKALESMPASTTRFITEKLLGDETTSLQKEIFFRILGRIGGNNEINLLLQHMAASKNQLLRVVAGRALRSIRRRIELNLDEDTTYESVLHDHLTVFETITTAWRECGLSDHMIYSLLYDRGLLIIDTLFSLLSIKYDQQQLIEVEANLFNESQVLRSNALELLEILLPKEFALGLCTFLTPYVTEAKPEGWKLSSETEIKLMSYDAWIRAIVFYINNKGEDSMAEEEKNLLNLIPVISFLKGVNLFKDVPSEYLIKLAELAEPREFYSGEVLFNEGDPGDSLYLIRNGTISVRKKDKEVVRLGARECIGEMALLDGEPRSATCVVAENTTMLRISGEDFSNLLDIQPQIVKALLRTLAKRLRAST